MKRLKGSLPPIVTYVFTVFMLVVLPFLTLIGIEVVVRNLFDKPVLSWLTNNTDQVIFNYLLLFSLGALFYLLPRRLFYIASLLVMGIALIFGVANRLKLEFRSTPITLDDFQLIDELTGFEFPMEINYPLLLASAGAFVVFIGLLFFMIKSPKERYWIKIPIALAAAAYLFIVWSDRPFSPIAAANIKPTLWKLETGLISNGVLGNFVVLAKEPDMETPVEYSKEKVKSLHEHYAPDQQQATNQPNVVYIMSESFIDPYILGEEYFIQDPVPNYRKYAEQSLHGTMYSPEFGGGTANVEFEALTGFSAQFMRPDQVAFQQFIRNEIPTVPYLFKDAGYETTAIHAYFAWFYQRDKIYQRLGFDRFYSAEFMELKEPTTQGGAFPDDGPMTDAILETLHATEGPDFIHAVSTEAHVPYWSKEDSEFVKQGSLPEAMQKNLQFYIEKIRSVDEELGRLFEALEQQDEETLVVFWGDHFPAFPNNNELYGPDGVGLVEDMRNNYEDYLTTHGVPYFIWSSKENTPEQRDISPSFVPALILDKAQVTGNEITEIGRQIVEEGSTRIPFSEFPDDELPLTTAMLDLQLLQYDWLHGQQFAEEFSQPLVMNKDYHLGLYPEIKLVNYKKSVNTHDFIFEGAPKFSKVVINGEQTESFGRQYLGYGVSKMTIPHDQLQTGDEVELVVLNSRDRPLMKSTKFIVE